jgi:membrane protein DedA with SNARE-associated domain/rhodanese-related sulfurtransferase
MNETIDFLLTHGYSVLFSFVLAEQLGLPVPSTPVLLAAGALGGLGRLNLAVAWPLAVLASLIGDSFWFYLGKTRGMPILRLLCKISLEPESCVRKTKSAYSNQGARWLLFAKFVPGLNTLAPPMAGMFNVGPWSFIAMDAAGAGLWAGAFMLAGWLFRDQMELIASLIAQFGFWLGTALISALALYIAFKYANRVRARRSLRIARITPFELKQRMDQGESITIVDLRDPFEWQEGHIPGSLILSEDELDSFVPSLLEGEVVLYCSCPNDVSSASVALRLKRKGVQFIRPLKGGFPNWIGLGLPVEVPQP